MRLPYCMCCDRWCCRRLVLLATFDIDVDVAVVSEIKMEILTEVAIAWKNTSSILLQQKKLILCRKGFINKKKHPHKSTIFTQSQETSNDNTTKKNYEKSVLIMQTERKKRLFLYREYTCIMCAYSCKCCHKSHKWHKLCLYSFCCCCCRCYHSPLCVCLTVEIQRAK